MRRVRLVPTVTLALLSAVVASGAQSDSRRWAPAMVVDSFAMATRDARWDDAVRFLDLDAFAALHEEQVRAARAQSPGRKLTPEFFLEHDPKMPRAVAEYQAKEFNDRSGDFDMLGHEYARVPSIDSLARLSIRDAAARWLEAKDLRWGLHLSLARQRKRGCAIPDSVEAALVAVRPPAAHIIGTVIDDSLAYVLHDQVRDEAPPPNDTGRLAGEGDVMIARRGGMAFPPRITTLRRLGGQWRVVPGVESGGSVSYLVGSDCRRARGSPRPTR